MGFSTAKSAIENGRKISLWVLIIGILGEVSIINSSHHVRYSLIEFLYCISIGNELKSFMKVTIFGSGNIGGYFDGRLAQARQSVTFMVHGASLAAMTGSGLCDSVPYG